MQTVKTRVGWSGVGDHRFRGFSVMEDLTGNESYAAFVGLAVVGRRFNENEAGIFEDIAHVVTAADARVWPLKVGRILSSYGRIAPGMAGIMLAVEGGNAIGPWVAESCAKALLACATFQDAGQGDVAAFLKQAGKIGGWGVPLRPIDERVLRLREMVKQRGRDNGRFWKMYEEISDHLRASKRIEPNVAGAAGALFLDMGVPLPQVGILGMMAMAPMFAAHAVESSLQQDEVYRRLPPEAARYVGHPPRPMPAELDD